MTARSRQRDSPARLPVERLDTVIFERGVAAVEDAARLARHLRGRVPTAVVSSSRHDAGVPAATDLDGLVTAVVDGWAVDRHGGAAEELYGHGADVVVRAWMR